MDKHLYHVKHSCGHDAYWESQEWAAFVGFYPCPWCGGQSGKVKIPRGTIAVDPSGAGKVYPRPDVYAAGDNPNDRIIVHHRANNSCCQTSGQKTERRR